MPRNFDDRLTRLRARRMDDQNTVLALQESYEKRSTNKATKYALGAMQEVDPRSTQISREEAHKVERNLKEGLQDEGLFPEFRLQGSVPLNVHIRGASDVDLLVIEGRYLRCERCEGSRKTYLPYDGRGDLVDDVLFLRSKSEEVLERRFLGGRRRQVPRQVHSTFRGGISTKSRCYACQLAGHCQLPEDAGKRA